jgi:NAD(P)H-dependent FMN reductase
MNDWPTWTPTPTCTSSPTGSSAQWRAKPVAFISYGGMAGGLRAVEALHRMARQLLWWATAVRTTRDQLPYPA